MTRIEDENEKKRWGDRDDWFVKRIRYQEGKRNRNEKT